MNKENRFSQYQYYLAIAGLFAAALMIVRPFGDYLVDDEWAFVKSVEYLFAKNRLKILDWNPMSLIFHTFSGALFSRLFGFSFTTLKLSTVLLSFIGVAGFFSLLTELGINKKAGIFSTLLIIFNPLYFFLNFTFMTDVPFFTWLILSTLFYYKGEKDNSLIFLFAGSVFATFSLLIRQHGFFIPVSVVLYYLINLKYKSRVFKKIVISLLLPLISFLIFEYWYFFVHGSTVMYNWQQQYVFALIKAPWKLVFTLPQQLIKIMIYMGFFSIPLSVSLLPSLPSMKIHNLKIKIFFILISLTLIIRTGWEFAVFGKTLPYFSNKITSYGLMLPNELLFGNRKVIISQPVWIFITGLSLFSTIFLFYFLCAQDRQKPFMSRIFLSSNRVLIFFIGLTQLFYLIIFPRIFFDRYLIILIPFILMAILLSTKNKKISKILYFIFITPYIIFSLISTMEVNNLSKASWEAATYLTNNKVSLMSIDGGYSWNGWNMFEFSSKYGINNSHRRDPWWIKNIAPSINSKYVISLSPKIESKDFSYINDEYVVTDRFEYRSFIEDKGYVYILRKKQ